MPPIPKESIAAINIKEVWEAMENCVNLGLTKSIGVSNSAPRIIEEILSIAKIPPAVNQVIIHYICIVLYAIHGVSVIFLIAIDVFCRLR